MTIMAARSGHRRSTTGDYLEDVDLLVTRKSRTPINVSHWDNPVLATLIQDWDEVFPEKTPDLGVRVETSPKVTACLIGESGVAFTWRGHGNFMLAGHRTVPGGVWTVQLTAPEAIDIAPPNPDSPSADVIRTVKWIVEVLGVTDRDVLRAAGIRPRTYYHWKKNPDTAPRLASQAGLWALAQSVESIVDDLGNSAAHWMKADPSRRELFVERRHGRLAALAASEPALRGLYDDPLTLRRNRSVPVGDFVESDADG